MQDRGYSIKSRTIRLTLSELDDAGLTEKIPGKGRQLTDLGRRELTRANVHSRYDDARAYISTLTSQVTYTPETDSGDLVVSAATIPAEHNEEAVRLLDAVHNSEFGPLPLSTVETSPDELRLRFPSSITLNGLLIQSSIDAELKTAGIVEYRTDSYSPDTDGSVGMACGGQIDRYINTISGEGSSIDVVTLLIEAGRTNVYQAICNESRSGLLVVDNREVPLQRFESARELSTSLRDVIGGVIDLRLPRESGPFPTGPPAWDFASITYGGTGENIIALLVERGLVSEWETLSTVCPWEEFKYIDDLKFDHLN
jgi:hypothetical protein